MLKRTRCAPEMDAVAKLNRSSFYQKLILVLFLLLLVLWGCQQVTQEPTVVADKQATPTIHALFISTANIPSLANGESSSDVQFPTMSSLFVEHDTATPKPTSTDVPMPTAVRTEMPSYHIAHETIYDEEFAPGWGLQENDEVEIDPLHSEIVHQGRTAIAITPLKDFGRVMFTIKPLSDLKYSRSEVMAISLWLNGGNNRIQLDNLAFTVLGSNEYPYWVPNDQSAFPHKDFSFSETRLYFLGFNKSIPPNTWVNVQVLMENLIFDPIYEYVTGFYIKNDEGYFNTFYVDDVSLMLIREGTEPAPTVTRTRTPTSEIAETETVEETPLETTSETEPTETPTVSVTPTATPTYTATPTTTRIPTLTLTSTPTKKPTLTLTFTPTPKPTLTSTRQATATAENDTP